MENYIPMPGVLIAPTDASEIIAKFHNKYRINTEGKISNIPTWVTFPDEIPGRDVDQSILNHPMLLARENVYLYWEHAGELYRTTSNEVSDYFSLRPPWDDPDLYLFDDSLEWCIAFTHELMYGQATILMGSLD